jgi:putative DNA primase/helicase
LEGSTVAICFDANVHDNENVRIARNCLAKELRGRGAHVLFADVPADLGVNGIDDVAGQFGPEKALEIIDSAYDPRASSTVTGLTEDRLAQAFEAQYKGQLHYDHHRGRWYVWDDEQGRWMLNEKRLAFHFAREVCRSLAEEKKEFAKARVYGAVEQIAQSMPTFAVTSEVWDSDIWLLGTPAGTVDLRTGKLRPAAKEDYITKSTNVAPDFETGAPIYAIFFDEITRGDHDLQRYLQRLFGYSYTGSAREQELVFCYGEGGNGKGVLLNTMSDIAGPDYAKTPTMDTFLAKRGDRGHSTDIAMLAGARLVTAAETRPGRPWDEALINQLTGGDRVTARFMRRDNFSYTPQFSLIISGNHAPSLHSVNEANRRRFRIVPFTFKPEKEDKELFDKLRPEWPAILAWVIRGAVEWYEHGLGEVPQVVKDETDDYFEAQDDIRTWVAECCVIGPNHFDGSQHLYASYERWCNENGEHPGSPKGLISTLKKQHGCRKDPERRKRRGLIGIAVKQEYEPDPRTGERNEEVKS